MSEVLNQLPSLAEIAAKAAAETNRVAAAAEGIGFYSEAELDAITSLSRVTRWRMIRRGAFPATVELSPGRKGTHKARVHEWIGATLEAGKRNVAG